MLAASKEPKKATRRYGREQGVNPPVTTQEAMVGAAWWDVVGGARWYVVRAVGWDAEAVARWDGWDCVVGYGGSVHWDAAREDVEGDAW